MKTKIFIACFLLLIGCFALAACDGAVPERISIASEPDSLTVTQGSTLDLTGGEIVVSYSDGNTKSVSMKNLEIRGLNSSELGEQTVVIVYKEKGKSFSATLNVTVVRASVLTLALDQEGVKVDYFDGDTFDPTNLKVTATLENGTQTELAAGAYEITPLKLTPSVTRVGIKYRGMTAYIDVTVRVKQAERISITALPQKTNYFVGDDFSSEGIDGEVIYNDGTKEAFGKFELRFLHSDDEEFKMIRDAQDKTVKIEIQTDFGSVTGTFDLNVTPVVPSAIAAKVNTPLVFFEGEVFMLYPDEEAVVFTVTFNNGDVLSIIGNDYDFVFPDTPLTKDTKSVRVSYRGTESPFVNVPVTVNTVRATSAWIYSEPTKRTYFSGETLDLSGLTLGVEYNNGDSGFVSYTANSGIKANVPTITGDEGETTVTITYGGQSVDLTLTIEPRPVLTVVNLLIENESSVKTTYAVGEAFDFSNVVFTFRLSNGDDLAVSYQDATVSYLAVVQGDDEDLTLSSVESSVAVASMIGVSFHVVASDEFGAEYESDTLLPITLS